ncbi:MAG: HTTM domain-containing protein [Saprospiraceae bacterium]|nr:HTTM domain-containing protein [Saprospiraceae bacterium]
MKPLNSLIQDFQLFFTAPISPKSLGIFRILITFLHCFKQLCGIRIGQHFFGEDAWVQWEISKAFNQSWHIHIQDIYNIFQPLGISTSSFVEAFFWVYFISAMGLLLGWFTRVWAIFTWLCHYIMMSTLPTFVYGVDIFLQISLFYMMIMPVAKAYSLDIRFGRVSNEANWASTLAIRVLQIHLCLVYFSAGYEKMLYTAWWEGNVLWRSMVQPDFRQFDMTWLAYYPWIPMLLSWFTMIIETFYFIGVWIPRVRVFWLFSIIGLHIGIACF